MKYSISFLKSLVSTFALLFICTTMVVGQDNKIIEQDFQQFQQSFKKEYFSLGLLIQNKGVYQFKRNTGYNGFSISNARIKVQGELDERFGYKLQADVLDQPAIVDANLYYHLASSTAAHIGLAKSPFSAEYLTSAADLNFISRSKVVNSLAPKRQLGIQIKGSAGKRINYVVGVFNGNHLGANLNNDEQFLYAARLTTSLAEDADRDIKVGLNIFYGDNTPLSGGNLQSTFKGEQTAVGTDLHFKEENFFLNSEFIYSWLSSPVTGLYSPYGYYITGGYPVNPALKVLLRWDKYRGAGISESSELLWAGVTFFPSTYSKLQFNYSLPVSEPARFSQLLIKLQLEL